MSRTVAGALLATATVLGCAQPGSPPGGPIDRAPPRVVRVTPAAFDTLTDLEAPVVIEFDERISERLQGVTEFKEAVLISPATGEVLAERERRSLEIMPAGGWEADRVYRVVVRPVFRDLFGNQRVEPVDLIFSTGAPFPGTALAGFVTDRIEGTVVEGARVEAVRRIDQARFVAVTDTGGFFALRELPAGAYDLRAWLDQNRDVVPDFFEVQDTAETAFGVEDTAFVELALLPMDTTPAQLARVEVIDSAKLRLVFDDPFAPGPVEGTTRLYLAPDTTLVTTSGRLIHGSRLDSILDAEAQAREEQARRDSIQTARDSLAARDPLPAQDSLAADSLPTPAEPDTIRADTARARRPAGRGAQGRDAEPLPARELILLLPGTLQPDTAYFLEVEGVINIRGLPDGGGFAAFEPPPDTATVDSVAADTVPADSVPPDSAAGDTVPPDSVPPDTVPPDTIAPDTVPHTVPHTVPNTVPPAPTPSVPSNATVVSPGAAALPGGRW